MSMEPGKEPGEMKEEKKQEDTETCSISTEEMENFQLQRENLTWEAALEFAKNYKEEEDEEISTQEKEMYARQALLKGWNQKVLKESKVLLAGMGAVGRELAKDLALIGVGTIMLVDDVEIKEDHPPTFLVPGGTGPRVNVIEGELKKFNKFMKTGSLAIPITEVPMDVFENHDVIVACMNDLKQRSYLLEISRKLEKPYVEGACLGMVGFVQAWMPGDALKGATGETGEAPDQAGQDGTGGEFEPVYVEARDDIPENQAAASIIAGVMGQEIIKAAYKLQGEDIGEIQVPRYIKYDGTRGIFDPYPDDKDIRATPGKIQVLDPALLKKSTVFIAGVGALGCEIAKDLSLAGVGKLILVDLDTIETSNLSRQLLFRLEDIGRPKAEIAAKRVKELNPAVEVEHHFTKIQDLPIELYENCDVIIAALDNVQARFDLNVIARRVKRPMIEGGTVGFEGHVQVIVPEGAKFMEETACYRCVVPIPPPDNKLIAACTPKGIPQNREHCVLRAEWIFRKKMEREPDLDKKEDRILLTGAANKELEMLKERKPDEDFGKPFVLQDMENILKNKIPAIQTVSSVIASIESMEALKMAYIQQSDLKEEGIAVMDPTYLNYNGIWGIFDHLPVLKREDCPVCGTQKGIEYFQIPVNEQSMIQDLFLSLVQLGVKLDPKKTMVTRPTTKAIIYHPSIPSMSNPEKLLKDAGLKPGDEVLLTPFGIKKATGATTGEEGAAAGREEKPPEEPLKYQLTLISVS